MAHPAAFPRDKLAAKGPLSHMNTILVYCATRSSIYGGPGCC